MKKYYIVITNENMSNPIFNKEDAIDLFYDMFEEYKYVKIEEYSNKGVKIILEKNEEEMLSC